MKVFLLQEIIPSYRVPVFQRIAQLRNVDLTVFYSRSSKAMLRENLKSSAVIEGFRHAELGLWEIGSSAYQPGILWRVIVDRPDVVIAGNAGCADRVVLLLLCKILRIRLLWFLGGVPYIAADKIKEYQARGRLNRWFGRFNPVRRLCLLADGVIAYTEHARQNFVRNGYDENTVWVASNSPDTRALVSYKKDMDLHAPEMYALRNKYSPSGQKILFLLGRLNKARKVDVLLDAMRTIKSRGVQVSLIIVGDGSERKNLEEMARDYKLENIYFEGAIYDEKELSRYFYICDIFVTPGVASLAIKMAMVFGKPVLTVDYGLEVHDVEDGVNGAIFPMDDTDELARELESLLRSDELITRMGENGIRTIRNRVNIENMIEGFRKAIFCEFENNPARPGSPGSSTIKTREGRSSNE